jgi:biotin-dependent carboxylase-like uncharacterized protein
MTSLIVKSCGPMTSMQDFGRFGFQRYGVSSSGAMDRLALAAANALVGNAPGAAAIEFMLMGGVLEVEGGSARVAVAGAPCSVLVDGHPIPPHRSATLRSGQAISLGAAEQGVYFYLAAAGGFAVGPTLGSLSLQPRAGIGGFDGRPFQGGDRLPLVSPDAPQGPELTLEPLSLAIEAAVRVVLGPQDDFFKPEGVETLLSAAYAVSREADRMGYRLAGPKIAHACGFNIVSDGIVAGSVQVPGAGEPIVMMADRQTTGGYPKIATVISADLRVLAQRRTGQTVRFAATDMVEAQRIARERAALIRSLPSRARPARDSLPSTEDLLALNLAGQAADAFAPEFF